MDEGPDILIDVIRELKKPDFQDAPRSLPATRQIPKQKLAVAVTTWHMSNDRHYTTNNKKVYAISRGQWKNNIAYYEPHKDFYLLQLDCVLVSQTNSLPDYIPGRLHSLSHLPASAAIPTNQQSK